MNNYSIKNYSGKNTLIIGGIDSDISNNRNILLANLINEAIDLGYGNRISIIEMCPNNTSFKNIKFALENYYFSTTALTNTVKSIEAIGDNFYTRRIDCTETMEILRDKVLEVKRKKFPEKKAKL